MALLLGGVAASLLIAQPLIVVFAGAGATLMLVGRRRGWRF